MKSFFYFFLAILFFLLLFALGLFFVEGYEKTVILYHTLLGHLGITYVNDRLYDLLDIILMVGVLFIIFFVWSVVGKKKFLFLFTIKLFILQRWYLFIGKDIPAKYIRQTEEKVDTDGFDKGLTKQEKKSARQNSTWFGRGILVFYFFLLACFVVLAVFALSLLF